MLTRVAEDLWYDEFDLFMPGGVHFRGRMTVARLRDGSLWVHSPIPIDEALASELAALGQVGHVVAPNKLHHLHLPGCIERYPEAQRYAAPGLAIKRKDLSFHHTLGDTAPEAWRGELDQRLIPGNGWINEVVFLHKASRTLIVTDLVFNIRDCQGWLTPYVLRMAGAWQKLAQSRLWRVTTRDRKAAAGAVIDILAMDFDRLLMAHGQPVEDGARGALTEALRWMLKHQPLALPRDA